ncbi:uncharacterized protein N0V89_001291 [Didymosphaeria variabile]|uniref:Uncharacterized protein n=1 Tax=Didymosphaeria variabile TaxID=1932322 RepID=A0A9W9CGI6_9PLEO|nr:uncharacterized protein N0V89_001291 [Didymosphaeria variabile]KAJ4360724.1 hypothetical protein N0V89_001291 [Didymosphaeria variabile]
MALFTEMRSYLAIAALFTAAFAAPVPVSESNASPNMYYLPLTVTVFNDVTGAHAAVGIDTSGHSFEFGWDLFSNSPLSRDGKIIATSMQLSFPDLPLPAGHSCGVYNGDKTIGQLDAQHTYLDLDGQPGKAVETDVTNFIVHCDIYVVGQN